MKFKQILCACFLMLILCTTVSFPAAAASVYSDVPDSRWSAQAITRITQLNIFNGVGDGRFAPTQSISRAAFITALCRLFSWETNAPARPTFSDVSFGSWYYAAVETAYAHGAVTLQSSQFRPNDPITRQEMAAALVRALGYSTLAGLAQEYELPFSDVHSNRGYITVAYDLGLMGGTDAKHFSPDKTATREQAAVVLIRLYDKLHSALEIKDISQLSAGQNWQVVESLHDNSGSFPSASPAPLENLYALLRSQGPTGSPVVLQADATRWTSDGSGFHYGGLVSSAELKQLLADSSSQIHRSLRTESSYLIQGNTAIWFESDEDLSAKAQLAKLFGLNQLYILRTV